MDFGLDCYSGLRIALKSPLRVGGIRLHNMINL